MLLFTVANARLAGGGYVVAPRAVLDDGLLDVQVVSSFGLGEVTDYFGQLFEDVGRAGIEDGVDGVRLEVGVLCGCPAGSVLDLEGLGVQVPFGSERFVEGDEGTVLG